MNDFLQNDLCVLEEDRHLHKKVSTREIEATVSSVSQTFSSQAGIHICHRVCVNGRHPGSGGD